VNGCFPRLMAPNLTVTDGQQVTIALHNYSDQLYNLSIPEFNASTGLVSGGDIGKVSFTANRVGSFPVYGDCSSGNASSPRVTGCDVPQFNGTMTVLPRPRFPF
jgi:hypothetical protein